MTMNMNTETQNVFDPAAPLRPKPDYPPYPGTTEDLIAELTLRATHNGSLPASHSRRGETSRGDSDATSFDIGRWLIESLSHAHHHRSIEPRMYGPSLSEALCVLGEVSNNPVVTLTIGLPATGNLRDLMLAHETTIDHAFNAVMTTAQNLGFVVTLTVSKDGTTDPLIIRFSPLQPD
jgi:hypothetical protein